MVLHDSLLRHVVERIEQAQIDHVPYDHIVVSEFLPSDLYQRLLDGLPATEEMQQVNYPGTGYGKKGPRHRDFGYAYLALAEDRGVRGAVRDVFSSDVFARALLDKFAESIPAAKHSHFAGDAADYTSVFDLQVDLPGYAIAPHPDVPSKIITYQLYLSADDTLAEHGTMLCVPKDERGQRGRAKPARATARVIEKAMRRVPRPFQWIEKSKVGEMLGVGAYASWLPWSWFEVVNVVPAHPNHFLAFAPSERTFHAVAMDTLEGERPVIRGFIRTGSGQRNWISPHVARG